MSSHTTSSLGILAGHGDLVQSIIQTCIQEKRPYFIIAFEGQTDPALVQSHPHAWHRLGGLGDVLRTLKSKDIQDIVMIGGIQRPSLFDLSPDLYTAKLLARIGLKGIGDDGLLRFLVEELEKEGFCVKGIQDIMGGDRILLPAGALGVFLPEDLSLRSDIRLGIRIARTLGALDVGQSVMVDQGLVLGVEAIEGTDSLIERASHLKKLRLPNASSSGVLVKLCKPEQERRVDLPTLGVTTLKLLKDGGFKGVVGEASKTLLVDKEEMKVYADKEALFIWGMTREDKW